MTTTVGIRKLKARLSAYVRRVKKGDVVRVTDRGVVVAEIRSPASDADAPEELAGLAVLARRGLVRLGKSNKGARPPRSPLSAPSGASKRLLDDLREDRV